jgi:TPR repeat protein
MRSGFHRAPFVHRVLALGTAVAIVATACGGQSTRPAPIHAEPVRLFDSVTCKPHHDVTTACTIDPREDLAPRARLADCERRCDGGSADACRLFADLLQIGGPDDIDLAAAIHERGCAKGDMGSCDSLGILLQSPSAHRMDLERSFSLFGRACLDGFCFACAHAADLMLFGRGTPRDCAGAVRLHKRVCDQGEGFACLQLGYVMHKGIEGCVEKDDDAARSLADRACSLCGAACGTTLYESLQQTR